MELGHRRRQLRGGSLWCGNGGARTAAGAAMHTAAAFLHTPLSRGSCIGLRTAKSPVLSLRITPVGCISKYPSPPCRSTTPRSPVCLAEKEDGRPKQGSSGKKPFKRERRGIKFQGVRPWSGALRDRQDESGWLPSNPTLLQRQFQAVQDIHELLALIEGHVIPGPSEASDCSNVTRSKDGAGDQVYHLQMSWREAAIAMHRLQMLASRQVQQAVALSPSKRPPVSDAAASSGPIPSRRVEKAMQALASIVACALFAANDAARGTGRTAPSPRPAPALDNDASAQSKGVETNLGTRVSGPSRRHEDERDGPGGALGFETPNDGKLLSLALGAAGAQQASYPLFNAAAKTLCEGDVAALLFSSAGGARGARGAGAVGGGEVDVASIVGVMTHLSRQPRYLSPELGTKLGSVVRTCTADSVNARQAASLFALFVRMYAAGEREQAGADAGQDWTGDRGEHVLCHIATITIAFPPHSLSLQSCASLLNALVACARGRVKWAAASQDTLLRLFRHVIHALWTIPPANLVPRNKAAAAALSSVISSLGKLAVAGSVDGTKGRGVWSVDKRLFIQLSVAALEGRRSWLVTPDVLAAIANSLSKAAVRDVSVLRGLALAVRASAAGDIEARHCALLLNAFAQLALEDKPLFTFLAEVLLQLPPQAHSLQSAAMTLHAVATLGPEALEAKLRIRVLAHLSLAVRSVAVSDLHPLGVALVFNSIVKDEQSRTRVGGSGGVGDVDTAMLEHLLQGVRLWPERPPAAGRSGVGSEHSELGAANVRRRGGGGAGGWQLQSQDIANILNAVARLELVTATDEAVQRLATWAMAIEASVWDAAGISQVLHALSRIANVQSSTLAAIPCQLEQVLEHLTLAAIQVPPHTLNAQAVSLILNAQSLTPSPASPLLLPLLFARIRTIHDRGNAKRLSPKTVSFILNALFRLTSLPSSTNRSSSSAVVEMARRNSRDTMRCMVAQTLQLLPEAFEDVSDVAVLAARLYRGQVRDRRVYLHLARITESLSLEQLSPSYGAGRPPRTHPLASLLSTYAALGYRGKSFFRCVAWALARVSPGYFSPQDISTILNALARSRDYLDVSWSGNGAGSNAGAGPALQLLTEETCRYFSSRRKHADKAPNGTCAERSAAFNSLVSNTTLHRDLISGEQADATQAAIILNALVRLEYFDAPTFLSLAEFVTTIEPAGSAGSSRGSGEGGDGFRNEMAASAQDIALLANAFSRVPDASWQQPDKVRRKIRTIEGALPDIFSHLSRLLLVSMQQREEGGGTGMYGESYREAGNTERDVEADTGGNGGGVEVDLQWAKTPVYHHHSDGTVHSHVGGADLHSHAADGTVINLGAPAPWGGDFVKYKLRSGLIVTSIQSASRSDATRALAWKSRWEELGRLSSDAKKARASASRGEHRDFPGEQRIQPAGQGQGTGTGAAAWAGAGTVGAASGKGKGAKNTAAARSRVWDVVVGKALEATSSSPVDNSSSPSRSFSHISSPQGRTSLSSLTGADSSGRASLLMSAGGKRDARSDAVREGRGAREAPVSAVCPLLLANADSFSARIVCMVANGFARVGVRDVDLLRRLSYQAYSLDEKAFSAVGISQLLHALAVLYYRDEELIVHLIGMARRLPPRLFSAQSVANIAWALAVFDMYEEVEWLSDLVQQTYADMVPKHRTQLHQLIISCRQAGLRWGEEAVAQECLAEYTAFSRTNVTSSQLQQHVARELGRLGYNVEEECVHEGSGLSLDIYLPALSVFVEVDGPSHFVVNGRDPLGSTVLKRRLIRNLGLTLCSVPYWEWPGTVEGGDETEIAGGPQCSQEKKFESASVELAASAEPRGVEVNGKQKTGGNVQGTSGAEVLEEVGEKPTRNDMLESVQGPELSQPQMYLVELLRSVK